MHGSKRERARHPLPEVPTVGLNRRQKEEADELSRFIDAHGGRLGAYRGYGVANRSSSPPDTVPESREEQDDGHESAE